MANSFYKTFVFNSEAVRKMQLQPGKKVPSVDERLKKGREALSNFSNPSISQSDAN